jgi:YfiH family protein
MLMKPSNPEWLRPEWPAPPSIGACFTTRVGGFSQAPYDQLNLGLNTGDQVERVHRNRHWLSQALKLEQDPCWLQQVHGTTCLRLPVEVEAPQADAVWTDRAGVCCAILTADCLPVLLTDTRGTLVAAVHAGWRGLAAGAIAACVRQLPVAPENLLACIGPAIGPSHYEVDSTVQEALIDSHPDASLCFAESRKHHWQADLPALARLQLQHLGISDISGGQWCTASDPARFFSYRRDQVTGRMAALIWIKKASNSAA